MNNVIATPLWDMYTYVLYSNSYCTPEPISQQEEAKG